MKLTFNIKVDPSGAVSAAIIMLPMSIGYGIIAYSPFGMTFAPAAALLDEHSAVLCFFVDALLRGTPIQISGPRAPLNLALAAGVAKLTCEGGAAGRLPLEPAKPSALAPFKCNSIYRTHCGI